VTELILCIDGKIPSSIERLKSNHRGKQRTDLMLYKKVPDIPSGPTEFTFFSAANPFSTSSILKMQSEGKVCCANGITSRLLIEEGT
jgi:hypothetical protein